MTPLTPMKQSHPQNERFERSDDPSPLLKRWTVLLICAWSFAGTCQSALPKKPVEAAESERLSAIAGTAMLNSRAFDYVSELSDQIGPRMTGTPQAERAIQWGLATMKKIGLANVHREEFSVWRGWTRGIADVTLTSPTRRRLAVDAMGWVGATPAGGVDADVVQVDLKQVEKEISTASEAWAGKVIEVTRTGDAPDRATELTQLDSLLKRAIEVRAVAVIAGQAGAKSVGSKLTHTGILGVGKSYELPVISMALEDQDQLERLIASSITPRLHIDVQNAFTPGPIQSANVIGEIPGTEFPEQVLVVSGHLDSWDLAEGATDNGCGVATALETAAAILGSGMKPRRTIRFILFTGEEQGMLGSRAYVEQHRSELVNHLGDINLDLGQAAVAGFNLNGRDDLSGEMETFASSLIAFGKLRVDSWPTFGSDTAPFTLAGLPGIMLEQDTKEYVVIHHSPADTLDKVDASIISRNAAVEAVLAFWIADRRERFAAPVAPKQTRDMLIDRGQEKYLKISGLWSFDK